MRQGYLSEYFIGVAAKVLSAVETDTAVSHQHEYNGVAPLKRIFGTSKCTFPARFVYLNDEDDEPVIDNGYLTWYDAREAHPTRSEFRLYFPTTAVSHLASPGGELIIALRPDYSILVLIAECNSTICSQLLWLFGVKGNEAQFSIRDNLDTENYRLAFASRLILEQIGIKVEGNAHFFLEDMIYNFGDTFPPTRVFSDYARRTIPQVCAGDNPDFVLIEWMEQEESLYRTFEEYIIAQRLSMGFASVDDFFQFSLSAMNRRKSRAGQALENHIEELLKYRNIYYDRTKVTENNSKPDFIFPSIMQYHNPAFRVELLTMLGVKSTCKDRWRQVLFEADRIRDKHLLTLEAAISVNQTHEMKIHQLQLVVPEQLHETYTEGQRQWLMTVKDFMEMLLFRQRAMSWH